MTTTKQEGAIIKRIIVPIICISIIMFVITSLFAFPKFAGSQLLNLFKELLVIFIGIDAISIGYISSTICKTKNKTKEEINSNKTVLFSLNFLTSALALKIIAVIL